MHMINLNEQINGKQVVFIQWSVCLKIHVFFISIKKSTFTT